MTWILFCLLLLDLLVREGMAKPVSPDEAGIIPLTSNLIFYRFGKEYPRGGQPNIAILDNNNVVVAWQDNTYNIGAGWILLNPEGEVRHQEIRSLRKEDGMRTALHGMYFPLVAANLFGSGFLFGVTFFDWHGVSDPANRMPRWENQFQEENTPLLQQIDSMGDYLGSCFLGFSEEFLSRKGQIRLADLGYLSDGNIVAIAEDQQDRDGPDLFQLPKADRVAIAGLLGPDGTLLRGPVAINQSDRTKSTGLLWYGLAIGQDGFGVRYDVESPKIRFFDNRLNPISEEITLPRELTGGGRGENVGWHGNGKDAFLLVSPSTTEIYHTDLYYQVFDSRGNPKFAPHEMDTDGYYCGRCDGAIDPDGNFVTVGLYLPVEPGLDTSRSAVVARYFNPDGTPKTPTFWVSAIPAEDWAAQDIFPRIALRNGLLAVVWLDRNTNLERTPELAVRIFRLPE